MVTSRVGIRKLLVPIDGSLRAEAALPITARLAQDTDSEVVLLYVSEVPETSELEADARRAAQEYFTHAGQQIPGAVRTRIEPVGDVTKGILHAVAEEHPDMIVMASRANFGLSEYTKGSVTSNVIRAGVAPVTVVYAPEDGG